MSGSNNTASFMLRFTQQLFENEKGISDVQWRGKISHVQGGEEKNFTEVEDAIAFIQSKLANLTLTTTANKSKEEQEGILSKSFDIWKKMAQSTPKLVLDTLKDPKSGVAQIKGQISDVSEEIGQKLEIDSWRGASKSDIKSMVLELQKINKQVALLSDKIESLQK